MFKPDGYHEDLFLAFVARGVLFASILALIASLLTGCLLQTPQLTLPSVSAETRVLRDGEATRTWIQTPQRGIDEKSNSAPIEAAK